MQGKGLWKILMQRKRPRVSIHVPNVFGFLNSARHNDEHLQASHQRNIMKILCWNVHGLGTSWVVRRIQHVLKINDLQILYGDEIKFTTNGEGL